MASSTIQSLAVPRALRVEPPCDPPAHSGADDAEADTRCQNSEVAMFVPQTSKIEKSKGQKKEQNCQPKKKQKRILRDYEPDPFSSA
jgi:hypothetical protein